MAPFFDMASPLLQQEEEEVPRPSPPRYTVETIKQVDTLMLGAIALVVVAGVFWYR